MTCDGAAAGPWQLRVHHMQAVYGCPAYILQTATLPRCSSLWNWLCQPTAIMIGLEWAMSSNLSTQRRSGPLWDAQWQCKQHKAIPKKLVLHKVGPAFQKQKFEG